MEAVDSNTGLDEIGIRHDHQELIASIAYN
jgi:hypothetical protein